MRYVTLVLVITLTGLTNCTNEGKKKDTETTLLFTIYQESNVYRRSIYGEAPQFAIWLENKETGEIRSVFVTYRTATGDFKGKTACPVSLPVWIGAFRKETGRTDFPVPRNPAPDAITGATPKKRKIEVHTTINSGSDWYYYIEMNVSGDYTPEFSLLQDDWTMDDQGNGQPSIIYKGEISGISGQQSTPILIGRSEQIYFSSAINQDLNGIKNAKDVFSEITVKAK